MDLLLTTEFISALILAFWHADYHQNQSNGATVASTAMA